MSADAIFVCSEAFVGVGMVMRNISLFLFFAGAFLSCHSGVRRAGAGAKTSVEPAIDSSLLGYWIPEKINWRSPHSGDDQIDKVVRSAYFKILRLDTPNRLSFFAATMNYPKGYDSLIFEYEPGVAVYCGTWKEEAGMLIVNYQLVYSDDEKKTDEAMESDTVRIGMPRSLLFDTVNYIRTTRFDAASLKKIDAYQAEAGARSSADVLQTGDGLAGTRWVARVAGDCSLRQ
jgi:hypothetical protein